MSAERPRRSEPLGASGGAAGEGTAAAPGGRLREGARHERRNLHHPPHSRVVRGFAGASREGGGAALRSAALRECEGRSAGAPSWFERSEKQSWAAPRGTEGPKARGPWPRAAQRARRASRASGCEQMSRPEVQGSGQRSVPCGRRAVSRRPKAAAWRAKQRGPCGPLCGGVSARTGCRRRTGRLRSRERACPRLRRRPCGRP